MFPCITFNATRQGSKDSSLSFSLCECTHAHTHIHTREAVLKTTPKRHIKISRQPYTNFCRMLWSLRSLYSSGEGDDRGRDGWMASPTWWTWVWALSGSWWRTGKPGVLQSMGSQGVGHDWATELNLSHRYFILFLLHIISACIFYVHLYAFLFKFPQQSCVCVCVCVCAHLLSHVFVSDSLWTCEPWNHKTPLSIGFFRQEYWSGLPSPPPGDLPDPGSKPTSDLAGGFFTTEPPEKPSTILRGIIFSILKSQKKGFMTSLKLYSS